ncbi:MAG: hypothetical protein Q8M98_08200 [Candidatus Cloacimonadaceae bacterium]|nr:hypothetical protein [Candidatus Cloacimonadaceae bacterium]
MKPITWYKSNYFSDNDAYMALSDIFYDLFNFLGPDIIIFDPYFIGPIQEHDATNALSMVFEDQRAFINAIGRYLFESDFTVKFTICGYPKRAKTQIIKDNSSVLTKLEDLYTRYPIYLNGIMPPKKLYPNFVDFVASNDEFHNRYYFSRDTSDGSSSLLKPIVVTNSIGNIKEVDIVPVNDELQCAMICSKYINLLSGAKSINEVLNG